MKYLIYILLLFSPLAIKAAENPIPTYYQDTLKVGHIEIAKKTYQVYEGTRGGQYIIRISGKTGNPYKYYLTPEQRKIVKV